MFKRPLALSTLGSPFSDFAELFCHHNQSCVRNFGSIEQREVIYMKRGLNPLALRGLPFLTLPYCVVILKKAV